LWKTIAKRLALIATDGCFRPNSKSRSRETQKRKHAGPVKKAYSLSFYTNHDPNVNNKPLDLKDLSHVIY